jgi:hypothetical protein
LKVYQATNFRNTDAAREILKGIQLKPKFLSCQYDNSCSIEGTRGILWLGQKRLGCCGCCKARSSGARVLIADPLAMAGLIAGQPWLWRPLKLKMKHRTLSLCLRSWVGLGGRDDLKLSQGCWNVLAA